MGVIVWRTLGGVISTASWEGPFMGRQMAVSSQLGYAPILTCCPPHPHTEPVFCLRRVPGPRCRQAHGGRGHDPALHAAYCSGAPCRQHVAHANNDTG